MRTTEHIIPVTVRAGTSSRAEFEDLIPGKIIGVVVYKSGVNNPGFVRASIKDAANFEVSKSQHIDNYRSREAEYEKGCKPLDMQGGKKVTVEVNSTEPFTEDTQFEFIFIYADTEAEACPQRTY